MRKLVEAYFNILPFFSIQKQAGAQQLACTAGISWVEKLIKYYSLESWATSNWSKWSVRQEESSSQILSLRS